MIEQLVVDVVKQMPVVAILLYIAYKQQEIIRLMIDACLKHLDADQVAEIERDAKLK